MVLGPSPLKLGASGTGSPRESGGRETVLSGSGPKGEIMGGQGEGRVEEGLLRSPSPHGLRPQVSPGVLGEAQVRQNPQVLWAPHPQDEIPGKTAGTVLEAWVPGGRGL